MVAWWRGGVVAWWRGGVVAWWRGMQKEGAEGPPALSPCAYCQARARLDLQTLRLIHGHLAWSLERPVQSALLWLGRRVKIVDGTTLSMPDTTANAQSWPQPSSQKEGLGFPGPSPCLAAPARDRKLFPIR